MGNLRAPWQLLIYGNLQRINDIPENCRGVKIVIILTKEQKKKKEQLGICRPDSILHLSKKKKNTGTYN